MNDLKKAAIVAEHRQILRVLAQSEGNKARAARILGIDRKTLYNKLDKYKALQNGQ